jgi:hypothetical protein
MQVGLKWGAIVGVAAYLVAMAFNVLYLALAGKGNATLNDHPVLLIPVCGVVFALLFACSAAGFYSTRETGVIRDGVTAGVVVWVVLFVLSKIYTPGTQSGAAPAAQNAGSLIALVIAGLLVVSIAAGMGWLGARPGAQQHARRHPAADALPPAP